MRVAPEGSLRGWLRFRAFCASLTKSDWQIEDYPRVLFDQRELNPSIADGYRWRVDVPGWLGLSGLGETPQAAEENLYAAFVLRRQSLENLPRPGISFSKIQFATNERVASDSDLQQKFIFDVLHLSWAWISDESSLHDFSEDTKLDVYYKRIQDAFGVDVSDVEGAGIADILDRIKSAKQI